MKVLDRRPSVSRLAARSQRLAGRIAVSLVAASLIAGVLGAATTSATTTYATDMPMILQNVPPEDLLANRNGICDGSFKLVIKNVGGNAGALRYLDAAKACGLQAILYFSDTISSSGVIYPSRIAPHLRAVRAHPALYGYLSVKEPSWTRVSGSEIRTLYRAYHAADPSHPVVALFGDIPHFGTTRNPFTAGMANIVMVDWYPVETASSGCSRTGSIYISTGPRHFKAIRAKVDSVSPGKPIWLLVQTHKYLAPSCHKKQRPTESQLRRQVRDGLVYLKAAGIGFHTFRNTNYTIDEYRDPTMVGWMRTVSGQIAAGTFQ